MKIRTIYHDPVTQRHIEGNAQLLRHIKSEEWNDDYSIETWKVCFVGSDDGDPVVIRRILEKKA